MVRTGFKQTEIGAIPNEWNLRSLGELGTFSKGKGIKKTDVVEEGLPCVRYGELYTHHHILVRKFNSYIPHEMAKWSKKLKKGDILFAGSGETAEEIGKCAAYLRDDEAYAGGDIVIFSPNNQDSMYLGYLLNSYIIVKQKERLGQGDAVVHINSGNLGQLIVPIPPLPEQRIIASTLNDVDALIESLERLIAKKRDIKQATIQLLLLGKKRLPGFTGKWKMISLGNVADSHKQWSFTGGPFGSNLKFSDYTPDGIRIIQLQNIGDGEFKDGNMVFTSIEKADELLSCNIYPGEIILSKMGDPVARACIIPSHSDRYLMSSDGIRLAVDQRQFNAYFVCTSINSLSFRKRAENASTGSTRKRIGLTELRNLEILCPEFEEQTAIARILSDMDEEIAVLRDRLMKNMQLKQGMMQELLTGKIRLV